jgi:hypothetical protein
MDRALTQKDLELLKRLYHPQTVGMMGKRSIYRRLKKLVNIKKVFIVGFIATNGRYKAVYCTWKCKSDTIIHELWMSKIVLQLGFPCLRGKDVDQRLLPDGTIGGLHLEMDLATEDLSRVEARLRNFIDTDDAVLVITTSPHRKQAILDRCSFLKDGLLCCTTAEALADVPAATDCDGHQWDVREVVKKMLKKR